MPHRLVSEHLVAALLELPEEGILSFSHDGIIETWSRGAERIYGYTAREITGQPLTRIVPLHELPQLESVFSKAEKNVLSCFETTERFRKDGSRVLVRIKRILIRDDQGGVRGILESGRALNSYGADPAADGPLRPIMSRCRESIGQQTRICASHRIGARIGFLKNFPRCARGPQRLRIPGCADRHTTPIAEHYEALRGFPSHFEYGWKYRSWEIRLEPLRTSSGEIIGCLGLGVDITDRKKSEEQRHYQARHDALTGLANYREFMDRLGQEVRRAERGHHSFTLLLLDLDGLKRINDLHGHLTGNRALQRLAAVMGEHCRSTDLAVRYGGDEFAVVLIDSDRGMAEQVAQRIENGLRTDQGKPSISVSIGVGTYPNDGLTAPELIEAADQQLYKYKRTENRRTTSAQAQLSRTKRASR